MAAKKSRGVSPDIWEEDWFYELSPEYKCFVIYLYTKASWAGIWRPNEKTVSRHCGGRISLEKALELINTDKDRIAVLENGRWLILRYVEFQIGRLSANSKFHQSIIVELKENKAGYTDKGGVTAGDGAKIYLRKKPLESGKPFDFNLPEGQTLEELEEYVMLKSGKGKKTATATEKPTKKEKSTPKPAKKKAPEVEDQREFKQAPIPARPIPAAPNHMAGILTGTPAENLQNHGSITLDSLKMKYRHKNLNIDEELEKWSLWAIREEKDKTMTSMRQLTSGFELWLMNAKKGAENALAKNSPSKVMEGSILGKGGANA